MSNFTDTYSISNQLSCPAIFDYLCWPQTPANQLVNVSCAVIPSQGVDPSRQITRHCLPSGNWSTVNFAPCFYPDVLALLRKSYSQRAPHEKQVFEKLVRIFRNAELVGLSISLTSILVSLFIFFTFKSLYCNRTKIHVNLLLAILIQITARLATYGIQMFQMNNSPKNNCDVYGNIHFYPKTSILNGICPLVIIVLQFGITAMFMWMLCEGIHLNNVLTVSVFKNRFKTYYFHLLGWVVPLCLTLSWSMVMLFKQRHRRCFYNYNHLLYYWIIDGPRYAVMIINVVFLLNIIRVLLVKIKEGSEKQIREEKSDLYPDKTPSRVKSFVHRKRRGSMNAKFVRKAVKAAIFLLPLLGITHMLETFVSADEKSITVFAIYCCVNVILMSLQGFYCSLLYCFLNVEVRETLTRRFQTTRIWYRWKGYLGDKNRTQNGTIHNENRSRLPFNPSTRENNKPITVRIEEHRLTSDTGENNLE